LLLVVFCLGSLFSRCLFFCSLLLFTFTSSRYLLRIKP